MARFLSRLGLLAFAAAFPQPAVAQAPAPHAQAATDPRLVEAEQAIQQATALIQQGQYAPAKVAAQRAMELIEAALGKDVPQLAEPLSLLGDATRMTGDVAGGEALQRRALALYEKVGAQNTAYYAAVLYRFADVLRMRGKFADALVAQQRLGALYAQLYGPSSSPLAVALSAQAELQRLLGRTDAALVLHESAVTMAAATYGPKHAYTASLIQAYASTLAARGEYSKAVRKFEQALAIMEAALGPQHMWVGQVAGNLGLELYHLGDLAAADKLYERALAIDRATLGDSHPFVAAVLTNQGDLLIARGLLDEAARKLQAAFAIGVQAYGEDHPEVIQMAEHYARVLRRMGQPAQARALLGQTLAQREKVQGKNHPDVGNSLLELASLALDQGEVLQAERDALRAMRLVERAHGPDHPARIGALDVLARLDAFSGDRERLLDRRREALRIHLATNGPSHPNTAAAQTNLADALLPDDPTTAVALMRQALAIQIAAFGEDQQQAATAHGNLGAALAATREFAEARAHNAKAMMLDARLFGADSRELTADVYNLAMLDALQGKVADAERNLRRALAMVQKHAGADAGEAFAEVWRLADMLDARGAHGEALALREQGTRARDAEVALLLWSGDEQRKASVLKNVADETAVLIRHAVQWQPGDRRAADLALQTVLRRHGRAVDVLADTVEVLRRRMDPQDQKLVEALSETRLRLAAYTRHEPGPRDRSAWHARIQELSATIARHESELGQRSAAWRDRTAPEATVAAVQARLDNTTALLEFVVWTPEDVLRAGAWSPHALPARLAACVLRDKGPPAWFDLGPAAEVDSAVVAARKALADAGADPTGPLQALAGRAMRPLLPALQGATHWRVAADGALLLVPLAALPLPDGRLVGDAATLSYIGSGRELLATSARASARQPPLVLANPDFGPRAKGTAGRAADLDTMTVDALPGTKAEGQTVAELFSDARLLTGAAATKQALAAARGPRFLHVATHGFFLGPGKVTAAAAKVPLLRTGLLLAGFNRHKSADDGVLTALEAASLDLQGTELAVLSACNTGVGEVRGGDGVHGLRRALTIAGAQSVVLSLWAVDDLATRALMQAFYRAWKGGQPRAQALRTAQAAVRAEARWRHPFFWAAFVGSGG
ncbi:MAG: CHAT domain-containing protein [Deltaproteobacteria bacterium]|nr:CHAT domain-containing protein [Deltaproteobacteria bacterium]